MITYPIHSGPAVQRPEGPGPDRRAPITGMDRIRAAVSGARCDRIPVFCNLLDQGVRELGVSPYRYYNDGALVAEAQLRLREKYGYDNVWAFFYIGKETELFGPGEVLFLDDGPPVLADTVIKRPEDIDTLPEPDDLYNHPGFQQQLKCLKLLRAEVGGRYPICALVMAATTLASMLMGMDAWMNLLMFGPADLRDRLLAKCSAFCRRQLAAYSAAGADLLAYSSPFTSTDMVPLKVLHEVTLPWLARDIAPERPPGVVYFCALSRVAGSLAPVLARHRFDGVYLGPEDDIAVVKRAVDGRALTVGALDDIKMCRWTEAEVRQEVGRLVRAGKPGGKFVLNTSIMPLGVPERNIRAYVDAACGYGNWDAGGGDHNWDAGGGDRSRDAA